MTKWAHSLYEDEGWTLDETREDALVEGAVAARDQESAVFYIAPTLRPDLEALIRHGIDVGSIIERIGEASYEECPEDVIWLDDVAEPKLNELQAELEPIIIAWIKRHKLEPNWFNIGKVDEIMVEDCPE